MRQFGVGFVADLEEHGDRQQTMWICLGMRVIMVDHVVVGKQLYLKAKW